MDGPALVVVWADPGRGTGWCVVRVNIRELIRLGQVGATGITWWRSGQFSSDITSVSVDSYLNLCRAVWERSHESDVVVIGCEDFSLGMQSRDYWLLEPVRFLAVLNDRLRGSGVRVETQMPGEKDVITDERLKLWGLWKPGAEHARDAQRHALVFLRQFASKPKVRARYGY